MSLRSLARSRPRKRERDHDQTRLNCRGVRTQLKAVKEVAHNAKKRVAEATKHAAKLEAGQKSAKLACEIARRTVCESRSGMTDLEDMLERERNQVNELADAEDNAASRAEILVQEAKREKSVCDVGKPACLQARAELAEGLKELKSFREDQGRQSISYAKAAAEHNLLCSPRLDVVYMFRTHSNKSAIFS